MEPDELILSPPEWAFNCFPLPEPDVDVLTMEFVISTMQAQIDLVTEADTSRLGRALHVGHLLTVAQSDAGDWPAVFNARTGESIGSERSLAPLPMFERMNLMLNSSEFDHVLKRAAWGGIHPGS